MLLRKMLRTIWKYRSQCLSMIIMTAMGIGIFLGFNMEWVSLENDTNQFFEETGFADYRLVSKNGFSQKDAEKIATIEGVEVAGRYLMINADVAGTKNMVGLCVTENPAVSGFVVMDGEAYDPESWDGLWLSDKYAEANNVAIGDEMQLIYENISLTGTVRGLIEAGEQMICVRDESQLMPDYRTYGYVYISPAMLKDVIGDALEKEMGKAGSMMSGMAYEKIFPQINVISDMSRAEFSAAVDEALGKTLLVLSKNETVSYAEAQGEVNEGKTMGSVLPVLFLLIAVLTMVTTMHRIAAAEKTQIGTLKALGFRDGRILRHYTSLALLIGIAGAVPGVLLGFGVGRFIMNPNGMMGTYIIMPDWTLYVPWWCVLVIALIVAFMTVIGWMSTKSMLAGTAADALKPYAPKAMSRTIIERNPLWNKLSFGAKWNLRDILRHKSRSFMTLFGVAGCMILLVGAMGMFDTMDGYMDMYYDGVTAYTSRIFVAESADEGAAAALAERYEGDSCASVSVQIDEKAVSLDVYQADRELIRFLDEDGKLIPLPDDGALVCVRLAKEFSLKPGDEITVSPYGTSEKYTVRIAGVNRSMSESLSISRTYAETLMSEGKALTQSESYRVSSVFTAEEKGNISGEGVSSVQSKQDIIDSFDGFMEIMYMAVFVLIFAAVVLGFVVLYNLGVMSYTERYREMATLKVVGFKDGQIGRLLISQNMWLSIIGMVIGLPCGVGVLQWLLDALASEYELKLVLGPLTYGVSIALTLGVSLAVGVMVARKNRKIDMVAALKTQE